jgi:hypothetical protein
MGSSPSPVSVNQPRQVRIEISIFLASPVGVADPHRDFDASAIVSSPGIAMPNTTGHSEIKALNWAV